MASRLTYTLNDYSGEKSNFALAGPTLTNANLDATVALVSGVRAAIDPIVLAVVGKESLIAAEDNISSANAGSPYAQRELKLLFTYVGDTSGKELRFTVAAPDLAALTTSPGSDAVVLADGDVMADFVSAVEAFARMPDDPTETITITSCRLVGRNL